MMSEETDANLNIGCQDSHVDVESMPNDEGFLDFLQYLRAAAPDEVVDIEQSLPRSGQGHIDIVQNTASIEPLDAVLVENLPEEPVYDAFAVRNRTCPSWWKQWQKHIFVALVLLIIGAMVVSIALLVGESKPTTTDILYQTTSSTTTSTYSTVATITRPSSVIVSVRFLIQCIP